ncbi:MAG: M15 family metallopeptidase [Eubacterium sp.]|nr:M15 family metallopeptidase [Eubacterium sp.]
MGQYKKKKSPTKKLLLFLVLVILGSWIFRNGAELITQEENPILDTLQIGINQADTSSDWNLILVNRTHRIPKNYEMELTELSNGQKVDSRIYPELQAMFDAARADGLQLFVREGYRTSEEQQQILDEKIAAFENEGNSRKEAKELAKEWVAVPGTSEHELGLSVDINANTSVSSRDSVYTWLAENAHSYGFIKRYPSDKTEITGINNEPWHYRYVGKETAEEIKEKGVCLEEYIEELRK